MVEIPFWAGELSLFVIWVVVRTAFWIKNRGTDWRREAVLLLMLVNFAVLLRITFFPMNTLNGRVQPLIFEPSAVWPFKLNLVPFVGLKLFNARNLMILNIVGNILMFVPSGILFPSLFARMRTFPRTLAAGIGLSVFIELLQLPFSVRTTDIDDIIFNTAGTAMGYVMYAVFTALMKKIKSGHEDQLTT